MKKTIFFIIILVIIIVCSIGFYLYKTHNNKPNYSSNYTAEKTSTDDNVSFNTSIPDNTISTTSKSETISKFSTKLPKDTQERYSNINLACETLNNTIVKAGETFSLWNTLGCPTKEKGYKKAKAFTSDGEIIKSYGGGICQVSTTIYNAIIDIDGIKVTERHEHSRDVVYIKDGKDAAVSYRSADLKFKNNLNYNIKIVSQIKDNKIVIKIEKV